MNKKPVPQRIDPHLVRMDLNTHARKAIDTNCVTEYAEAMERGTVFPPLTVFFNIAAGEYVLADGFLRLSAHLQTKPNDLISVEQYLGTAKDALRYAVGANKSHGLRRTNEDKRNAVELYFTELEGGELSDRQVAEYVGVSFALAASARKKLVQEGRLQESCSRTGRDGRTINTANIGKTAENTDFCGGCRHYKRGGCLLDGEDYPPTNPACGEFGVPLTPISARDEGVDIICKYDPNEPQEVRHRTARRHKGEYVRVPLDKTNTDRAAVEIRLFLGENYLASLAQSALKILKDEDQ